MRPTIPDRARTDSRWITGSHKKYKKCCLTRDEQRAVERPAAPPPPRRLAPAGCSYTPGLVAEIVESHGDDRGWGDLGLNPYAVTKLREGEVSLDHRPLRRAVERHRRRWTTDKLRAMSTEDIRARLAPLGVDVERDLLAPAAPGWSAWAVADGWIDRDSFMGGDEDALFARLATCGPC